MNNDPHDLDELVLHVQKTDDAATGSHPDLNDRIHSRTELIQTRLSSHDAEMRELQGVACDERTKNRGSPARAGGAPPKPANRHPRRNQASHSQNKP